jgi:hypothetical protein
MSPSLPPPKINVNKKFNLKLEKLTFLIFARIPAKLVARGLIK